MILSIRYSAIRSAPQYPQRAPCHLRLHHHRLDELLDDLGAIRLGGDKEHQLRVRTMSQGVGKVLLGLGHPPREVVVISGIFRYDCTIGAAAINHAADRKPKRVQPGVLERHGEHSVQEDPAEALEVRADHTNRLDQTLDQELSSLRVHSRRMWEFRAPQERGTFKTLFSLIA